MKFLALKHQLEKLEANETKRDPKQSDNPVAVPSQPQMFPPREHNSAMGRHRGAQIRSRGERVVGGDIRWQPVDKAAALLIAKAPWWAHAPIPEPLKAEQPKPQKAKKKRTHMNVSETQFKHDYTEAHIQGEKPLIIQKGGAEYFDFAVLAEKIIERINKTPQSLTPLARAAIDARAVLHESMDKLGGSMEDFDAKIKSHLDSVRQTRLAFVMETQQILGPLKDIRQFFLASTYETELARLKEFVDLCERLQKLKASGFLDSVTDTMLKLAEGPEA